MNYKNLINKLKQNLILLIMTSSIKKQKGLKRNGELNKTGTITPNTWTTFIDKLFQDNVWCYLTIVFVNEDLRINTILWKDEVCLLKKTINFPFKYNIYTTSKTKRFCLEIKLNKIPNVVLEAYKTLDVGDFCEYYKRAIKGY